MCVWPSVFPNVALGKNTSPSLYFLKKEMGRIKMAFGAQQMAKKEKKELLSHK